MRAHEREPGEPRHTTSHRAGTPGAPTRDDPPHGHDHAALLNLQRLAGNDATTRALLAVQRTNGSSSVAKGKTPVYGDTSAAGDVPSSEQWSDPESEYRLGTAKLLQNLITEAIHDRFGVQVEVILGGGGGVAARRATRGVHDLDLRLRVPDEMDPDERNQLLPFLQTEESLGLVDTARTTTTLRGSYANVEISITLAPVEWETRHLDVVGAGDSQSSVPIPLTVVEWERQLADKMLAFQSRDNMEKQARDAKDIVTLLLKPPDGSSVAEAAEKARSFDRFGDKYGKDWTAFIQEVQRFLKAVEKTSPAEAAGNENRAAALPLMTRDAQQTLRDFCAALKPKKPPPDAAEIARRRAEKEAQKAAKTQKKGGEASGGIAETARESETGAATGTSATATVADVSRVELEAYLLQWEGHSAVRFKPRSSELHAIDDLVRGWLAVNRSFPDRLEQSQQQLRRILDAIQRWRAAKPGEGASSLRREAIDTLDQRVRATLDEISARRRQR